MSGAVGILEIMATHGPAVRELAQMTMREHGVGNCACVSFRIMLDLVDALPKGDIILVHAGVTGQARLEGKLYFHAWVEVMGHGMPFVLDYSSGNEIVMPAPLYRHLSRHTHLREYMPAEAMAEAVRSGHYGPWDKELEKL